MRSLINLFLVLAAAASPGSSTEYFQCEYKSDNEANFGNVYRCNAQGLTIQHPNTHVSLIQSTHEYGWTEDDVNVFMVHDKNVKYFPQGLDFIFYNLEWINIHNCKLTAISKEDLKPFSKLRRAWFGFNNIEVLEGNLFEFNRNLEQISFVSNKLLYIDSAAFNGLPRLNSLDLLNCNCVSDEVSGSQGQVIAMIFRIVIECFNNEIAEKLKS